MDIKTPDDFDTALAAGPYTSVGSYPVFFLTADGGALAHATAKAEAETIREAIRDDDARSGWRVVVSGVNWEDARLIDAYTGERIESAYGEVHDAEADFAAAEP